MLLIKPVKYRRRCMPSKISSGCSNCGNCGNMESDKNDKKNGKSITCVLEQRFVTGIWRRSFEVLACFPFPTATEEEAWLLTNTWTGDLKKGGQYTRFSMPQKYRYGTQANPPFKTALGIKLNLHGVRAHWIVIDLSKVIFSTSIFIHSKPWHNTCRGHINVSRSEVLVMFLTGRQWTEFTSLFPHLIWAFSLSLFGMCIL